MVICYSSCRKLIGYCNWFTVGARSNCVTLLLDRGNICLNMPKVGNSVLLLYFSKTRLCPSCHFYSCFLSSGLSQNLRLKEPNKMAQVLNIFPLQLLLALVWVSVGRWSRAVALPSNSRIPLLHRSVPHSSPCASAWGPSLPPSSTELATLLTAPRVPIPRVPSPYPTRPSLLPGQGICSHSDLHGWQSALPSVPQKTVSFTRTCPLRKLATLLHSTLFLVSVFQEVLYHTSYMVISVNVGKWVNVNKLRLDSSSQCHKQSYVVS